VQSRGGWRKKKVGGEREEYKHCGKSERIKKTCRVTPGSSVCEKACGGHSSKLALSSEKKDCGGKKSREKKGKVPRKRCGRTFPFISRRYNKRKKTVEGKERNNKGKNRKSGKQWKKIGKRINSLSDTSKWGQNPFGKKKKRF